MEFDYVPERRGFRLVLGDSELFLPELDGALLRTWLYRHHAAAVRFASGRSVQASVDALEDKFDALLAYDRGGVLGTREAVEAKFTDAQVVLIVQRIAAVHAQK